MDLMLQSSRYPITPDHDSFSNARRKFSTSFSSLTTSSLATTVVAVSSNPSTSISGGTALLSTKSKDQIGSGKYLPPYRSLLSPDTKYDYKSRAYVDASYNTDLDSILIKASPDTQKHKMEYKSLLTPINNTKKKMMEAASDSLSIRSLKSQRSFFSLSKRAPPSFLALPDEVLLLIFENLLQYKKPLIFLLYVSKRISMLAKRVLYSAPKFTSTYRLGQFVHSLNVDSSLALMVKTLDLSNLTPGINSARYQEYLATPFYASNPDTEDISWDDEDVLASWRDWRYRNHALYGNIDLSPNSLSKVNSRSSDDNSTRKASSQPRRNSMPSTPQYHYFHAHLNHSDDSGLGSPKHHGKKKLHIKKYLKTGSSGDYSGYHYTYAKPQTPWGAQRRSSFNNNHHPESYDQYSYIAFSSPHPRQNRFLNKYSLSKDIPIGYILHLLRECTNLEHINLSTLSISTDFTITDFETFDYETSYGKVKPKRAGYPDGFFFGSLLIDDSTEDEKERARKYDEKYRVVKPIYWSDTNREIEWKNVGKTFIKLDYTNILEEIDRLKYLQTLSLNSLIWIHKNDLVRFLQNSESVKSKELIWMDCTDSGMKKSCEWATKKTLKGWKKYFKELETAVQGS